MTRFTQTVQFVLVLDWYALDMDQGQWMNGGEAEKEQAARVKKTHQEQTKGAGKNFTNRPRYKSTCPTPLLGLLTPSPTAPTGASQPQTISADMSRKAAIIGSLTSKTSLATLRTWTKISHSSMPPLVKSFGSQAPFEGDFYFRPGQQVLGRYDSSTSSALWFTRITSVHFIHLCLQRPWGRGASDLVDSRQFQNQSSIRIWRFRIVAVVAPIVIAISSAEHGLWTTSRTILRKFPSMVNLEYGNRRPSGNSILNIGERPNEAKWFMHYLDRVFYVVFPFYNSSGNEGCRAWILNLLMRDRSVYYAALALGQYHSHYSRISSVEIGISNKPNRWGEEYHNLALRDLQDAVRQTHTWDQSKCLIRRVQALTCLLHLLFLR